MIKYKYSGIFVRDTEVELRFLIWKVKNHSISVFYACTCTVVACKTVWSSQSRCSQGVIILLGVAKHHSLELPHWRILQE